MVEVYLQCYLIVAIQSPFSCILVANEDDMAQKKGNLTIALSIILLSV